MTRPRPQFLPALAALAALAAASGARAALSGVEDAYELDLARVTLPVAAAGSVGVRRCAGCAPDLLRVDADTRYEVRPGNGNVTLDELRREAARLATRPRTSLFIYYDPRTRAVRRIVLDATQ